MSASSSYSIYIIFHDCTSACCLQLAGSLQQKGGLHLEVSAVSRQQQRCLPIRAGLVDGRASSHQHADCVRMPIPGSDMQRALAQRIGQGGARAIVQQHPHTLAVAACFGATVPSSPTATSRHVKTLSSPGLAWDIQLGSGEGFLTCEGSCQEDDLAG